MMHKFKTELTVVCLGITLHCICLWIVMSKKHNTSDPNTTLVMSKKGPNKQFSNEYSKFRAADWSVAYFHNSRSRPAEGTDGKSPLLLDVTIGRQAVLNKQAVELPLGHVLVLFLRVPGIVQRHLEVLVASLRYAIVSQRPDLAWLSWLDGCRDGFYSFH